MKKGKQRIAVISLVLIYLFAALACGEQASWDCPECGRKGNTGAFCGGCAYPAPEPEPEITVRPNESEGLSNFGYTTADVVFREIAGSNSVRIRHFHAYALCQVNDFTEENGVTIFRVTYEGKTGYIDGRYFRQMTKEELEQFLGSSDYLEGLKANATTPTPTLTEVPTPTPKPRDSQILVAGDMIVFGHYEQDNDLKNGMEPIEWIVLDYDAAGNRALLLSRYGLDAEPYQKTNSKATWGKSTIRSWLNGTFLKTAFSTAERRRILKTEVDNSKSQGYSEWETDGGKNTVDQIFLLSYQEAFERYFKETQFRLCESTLYAKAKGSHTSNDSGKSSWWLRSPGYLQNEAALVYCNGLCHSYSVDDGTSSLRPALWLNLDSVMILPLHRGVSGSD